MKNTFLSCVILCIKYVLQGADKFSCCGVCWFYASASAFYLQRKVAASWTELSEVSCQRDGAQLLVRDESAPQRPEHSLGRAWDQNQLFFSPASDGPYDLWPPCPVHELQVQSAVRQAVFRQGDAEALLHLQR